VATLGAMAAILAFAVIFSPGQLFQAIAGPGSFYQVIPWAAMVIAAVALSLYGIGIMALGVFRFWRDTEGPLASKLDGPSFVSATLDVLGLRQMRGGGAGCTYPDGRPSHRRLVSHELVFFGFVLTFLSTVMAAAAQDLLDVLPPYPLWSPIVVAGTIGGLMQIAGCSGLIALKLRASEIPASTTMRQLDFAFLELLLALNVTGLALLVLRDSPAMGSLLVVHLGTVAGLFITMPYGKFVHGLYRYASLVRNRREELQEVAATSNRRSDPDILAGV
jgi:citrate/tricarballylate utilization protein